MQKIVLEKQLKIPPNISEDFIQYFEKNHLLNLEERGLQPDDHLAITFVTQKSMEQDAPLTISPKPKSVRRIFMLFGVVDTTLQTRWKNSHKPWTSDEALSKKDWAVTVWGRQQPPIEQDGKVRVIEWGMAREGSSCT